ncbi:MAG TPA: hypothetical protein VKA54_02640, partial [Gemmatimonadaceae bacterium]|nr:hypothetical protein [Gemmatimonadaceae bacterium]
LRSLADVARPESRTARRFASRVEAFLADSALRLGAPEIRAQLEIWRDNDGPLRAQLAHARQAEDIRVLSERLSTSAAAGLAALEALQRRQTLSAADVARYRELLTRAAAARAAVMSPAIPAIQKLVDRAAG